MNNTKSTILLLLILFVTFSCEKPLDYKYTDKPMVIVCSGSNAKLLNEALYSFFDDITTYYRAQNGEQSAGMSTLEAYANFIYTGAMGEADYKNLASIHSLAILKELKKDKQLWLINSEGTSLNYQSEFVSCLLENMTSLELKETMLALVEVNSLNPKILAERFRMSTTEAVEDSNFGMYIALDTYYRYLINLGL